MAIRAPDGAKNSIHDRNYLKCFISIRLIDTDNNKNKILDFKYDEIHDRYKKSRIHFSLQSIFARFVLTVFCSL